jgi:histidinol-phosphate aminotransferase
MNLSKRLDNLTPFSYCGTNYPVKLDANESCVALLPDVVEDIISSIKKLDITKYPDDRALELRKAYADTFGLDAGCVVAGNGSDELINMLIGRVLPDDAVVVGAELDFGSYWSNCAIYGKKDIRIKRNSQMGITADDLITAAKSNDADMVIFSNPNNPSGSIISRSDVIKLVETLNCLVVADEAYMDFADESVLDLATKYPNLVVLRTLSKAMGVAGARLGFAVSNPKLAEAMRKVRDAYNVSAVDQEVGKHCLGTPNKGVNAIGNCKDHEKSSS